MLDQKQRGDEATPVTGERSSPSSFLDLPNSAFLHFPIQVVALQVSIPFIPCIPVTLRF
jgi:hypothetical protein